MKDLKQLVSILKPLVPHMIVTILLGTLGYLAITAISVFGGMAIIQIGGFAEYGSISFLMTIIILSGIFRAIFRLSEQYCTHYIAFRLLAIIRDKIFSITRSLSQGQLKRFQKGEFMNIVTKDVELLEVFYAHTIAPVFIGILTTIVYVSLFTLLHPLFGVVALLAYVMIAWIIPKAAYRFGKDAAESYRNRFGILSNLLMDSMRGIKELIIFGYQKQTVNGMDQHSKQLNSTTKSLKKHEGILKAFTDCALYVTIFIQVILSIYLYRNHSIDGATALLALLLLISSFGPSLALSQLSASLVHTFASAKRVLQLLNIKPEFANEGTENIDDIKSISFHNVSFGYENSDILYQHVNMEWKKGEIVGIKGSNGVGKSTLISLLLQDIQRSTGQILINNQPIESFQSDQIRNQFSTVDAHTIVFSDTFRRNITMFKENYHEDEIMEACKKAGLLEFISSLSNGLDTYMQEYAGNISSGQLQRIALARLFLKNSPVYILDEPTNNLDVMNEKHIIKTIQEHAKDKLVIIISHNDSMLSIADRIYHINQQTIEIA
ncbi:MULTISPECIES: amino acid ABC transporter ATP-binding/permease protein [Bacillus]|uniref:amino acid ABC transporter ATP-binding/permease protein n=1 Tax=Bacillus TaxID=1386 RepID=UPI0002F944DB|nr:MULTISPECIES: ABC transporter ATP-binding protein [Bacillus]